MARSKRTMHETIGVRPNLISSKDYVPVYRSYVKPEREKCNTYLNQILAPNFRKLCQRRVPGRVNIK
jgi:hypothetical protein